MPIFAGRLRETPESLEIVCDDAGVPMMSYDLDGTVADAIGRLALPGSDYVDHIPAPATRAGDLPLLTVRITRLSDGGMVLGCSWHHAAGDMATFMLLMRAWSAFAEGTPVPETYVVEDMDAFLEDRLPAEDSGRAGFRLPSPEEAVGLNRELENAVRANRIVQAYFSDDEISRIRTEVTAAAGQRLSTNDVLCGHLVSTIRRLDDDPEGRWLAMPINIRRYIGVEPGTLGNLVNEVFLSCAPKSTADRLAVDIRAAVNAYGPTSLNIRTNRALLESVGRAHLRDCMPIGFDPVQRTFTVTNWSRFGVYDPRSSARRPTWRCRGSRGWWRVSTTPGTCSWSPCRPSSPTACAAPRAGRPCTPTAIRRRSCRSWCGRSRRWSEYAVAADRTVPSRGGAVDQTAGTTAKPPIDRRAGAAQLRPAHELVHDVVRPCADHGRGSV
jgi:hypothetical protein